MNRVAERAGLSPQMVSYVEREMRAPTIATFLRLCHALELDPVGILQKSTEERIQGADNMSGRLGTGS